MPLNLHSSCLFESQKNRSTLFPHLGWMKTTKKKPTTPCSPALHSALQDDGELTVFILPRQWRPANFADLVSQFL